MQLSAADNYLPKLRRVEVELTVKIRLSGAIADRLKEVGINRITAPVRLYFVRASAFLRKHARSKYVLYSCENARQVSVFSAPFTLDKKRQTEVRRTFNGKFFDL